MSLGKIFAYSPAIAAAEGGGDPLGRRNVQDPDMLFDGPDRRGDLPRVVVAPGRYVQGNGVSVSFVGLGLPVSLDDVRSALACEDRVGSSILQSRDQSS